MDERLHFVIEADNSDFKAKVEQTQRGVSGLQTQAEQASRNMEAAFARIGKAAAGIYTMQQAAGFASAIVSTRSQIQSLAVSFETLLGSKDKAAAMFGELKDFATKTPMQLNDLASAAQTLLGFNYDQSKVVDMLKSIGDISMGDQERFKSLALAFAQMSAAGKLMGQDLLQMINAGFNPLMVISQQTGKSISELKDEMSKGAISAQMVEDAFRSATSEGGQFNGMLLSQGQTMKGSLAQLEGAWADFLNSLGEKSEGVISVGVGAASSLLANYEALGRVLLSVAGTVGTYKAALMLVYVQQNSATVSTQLLTAAQTALNAVMRANPFVLAATAAVALAGAIYTLRSNIDAVRDAQSAFNSELEAAKQKKEEANQATERAIQLASSDNASQKERTESLQYLITKYGDIIRKYVSEEGHLTNIIALRKELAELDGQREAASYEQEVAKWERLLSAAQGVRHDQLSSSSNAYTTAYEDIQKEQRSKDYRALQEAYRKQKGWWADIVAGSSDYIAYAQEMARLNKTQAKDTRTDQQVTRFVAAVEGMQDTEKAKWAKTLERATGLIKGNVKRVAVAGIGTESYTEKQLQTMLAAVTGEAKEQPKGAKTSKSRTAKSRTSQKDYGGEYGTLLESNTDRQASEAEAAAFAIRQAEIAGMEAGFNKELATAQLKYDQLEAANKQRAAQMAASVKQLAQAEWSAQNPKASAAGKRMDTSGITADLVQNGGDVSGYSQTVQGALQQATKTVNEYHKVALMEYQQAETEALNSVLKEVETYQVQRQRLEQQYAGKRAALKNADGSLKTGVTQENVDLLDEQEAAAMEQLNERWAQTSQTYRTLCQEIAQAGLKELVGILKRCNTELTSLQLNGKKDSKEAAVYYAAIEKVRTAYKSLNEAQKEGTDKAHTVDWEATAKELRSVSQEAIQLGEALDNTFGTVLQTAGEIGNNASTIITSVQTISTTSINSISSALTAGTAALGALSAAVSIVNAIGSLFSSDDELEDEIQDLQDTIDRLNWSLDNADTQRLIKSTGGALAQVNAALAASNALTTNWISLTSKESQTMQYLLNRIQANGGALANINTAVASIASAYEQVAYSADKALGDERYSNYSDTLDNYAQQMLLIREQINKEGQKKSSDSGQISEWEEKIEELGQKMADTLNDMTEEILGGSAADIASELSDAFIDAFQNGEDAAEAWGDKVKDIAGDVVKRMMTQTLLENQVASIYDKYKSAFFKDGKYIGGEGVMQQMQQFAADLMGLESSFENFYNDLPDELKEFMEGTDTSRSSTSEGITQASQDSVDEMNARLTTIQSHTYALNENVKLVTQNTSALLQSVVKIEQHTAQLESMAARLDAMGDDLRVVRIDTDHFYNSGIKIK